MLRGLILAALLASCSAAQTFNLGSPSDPCTGGFTTTVAGTASSLRYGDFTCTFPVSQDGLFTLELDFIEPCYAPGGCGGGQVTAGGRAENVYVNDSQVLTSFDPFTRGATNATPAVRKLLVYSAAGKVIVRVQTVVRSGVLSTVVLTPFQAAPQLVATRAVCVGSGPGWDCTGWELHTINSSRYIAIPAWSTMPPIPACPAPAGTGSCWQPAIIGQ